MSTWQDLPEEEVGEIVAKPASEGANWVDLPAPNVRTATIGALSSDPEKTVQDWHLAQRYDLTPSLVGEMRSDFEQRAAADDASKIMLEAPKLADWYVKEPQNAVLAKDDLQNLSSLETLLDGARPENILKWNNPAGAASISAPLRDGGAGERLWRSLREGQASNRLATHGFIQMPLDALGSALPSLFGGLAETNREEIRFYQDWIANTPFTEADGAMKVWEDFVRSSPQMATQILLGMLSGGVLLPTGLMGTQISGGQYAELTEDGVDGGRAFAAALGNTAMQLPMEYLKMDKFFDIFKASGLGNIVKSVGVSATTSFITESLQNYPDALTTLWAKSTQTGQSPLKMFWDNLGQYTLEGMYEGALSMPWAVLGGGGKITYDLVRYRTLEQDTKLFSSLDESAAASKMKDRLPEAYQALVDHLTSGGPVQNIYIKPEALREALPNGDVLYQTLDDVGVSREEFNRAEELGADIEVPLNLYQGKIAGTELSLALRENVRTSPEGMTLAEQSAFSENFREQAESVVAEYRGILLQDEELNSVLAPIERELTAVYGKEGAKANIALLRARANLAAKAWSEAGQETTPAGWLRDVAKLRVEVSGTEQGANGSDLFMAAKKTIYSDDRSVKMTFEETGVEPSLTDRPRLRAYLESILPADVTALKSSDPDAYMNKLKEIVDTVFPTEDGIRFKTKNGVYDYDHFLTDVARQDYITTLPQTLKDQDVRVEFVTKEGEAKAYLIKKYFDQNTQKDIWDMLIIRDGELKTKIARAGKRKGKGYTESKIIGAGTEASQPTATGGNMESASTPHGVTEENITTDQSGVKQVTVLTAFSDTTQGTRNWAESNQKENATSPSVKNQTPSGVRGLRASLPSEDATLSPQSGVLDKRINSIESEVNTLIKKEENTDTKSGVDSEIAGKKNDNYQQQNTEIRGSISFRDNETLIRLFKDSADFSTFVHETGHLFVRDMENLVKTGAAPAQIVNDIAKLKAFTEEFSNPEVLQNFYNNTFRPQRNAFQNREFASLTEPELAHVRAVAEQEKLADAFVTYISEGKAPSPELRSVFQRFRIWLQKMYQALASHVKINDEIRGVFDRMLASDNDIQLAEQIHQAQAAETQALNDVAQKMLTEQEQARLLKARKEASETSREQRLSKVLQAYYRAGTNLKEIRQQALEAVNAMPVYAAQDQAIAEGSVNYDAVREEYGDEKAKQLLKKRPGLLRKNGGVSLQDLAVAHGFINEESLFDAICSAAGKGAEVKALVKEKIAAHEEVIRKEFGLDEGVSPGDYEYYSEDRLKAMELEARALSRASAAQPKNAKSFGTAETLRKLARQMLESMAYRETTSIARLSAAEAKQAEKAARALSEGDLSAAADAKRRQAINHAMVLEALKYKRETEMFARDLKRYAKSKRMVFEYQEQIRAIAESYKLLPGISPHKPDERASLRDFVDSVTVDSVFEAPPFSDFILSERVPENITLGELREVRDMVRWLASEGNPAEAKTLTEGVDTTIAEVARAGTESLEASGNRFVPRTEGTLKRLAQEAWQDLFAGLDHIKFMFMAADGYTEVGKKSHMAGFHSQWFQRVMHAQNNFLSMFRSSRPELDRIATMRTGFMRSFKKRFGNKAEEINGVRTPEVMRSIGRTYWTAEHIWCLARNMGNAGNLKTLHEGFGLSDYDLRALTSVLSKAEWMAIQAEGDLVGKHFEETDKVFRQIYGCPMPNAVEALPLTVETAEGETLELPGWYFPIAIDGRMNPEIGDRQEIALTNANPDFVAYGPAMAKNFTKSRSGTGRAVGLYFGVLDTALQDQWRFMTMAPVVRDMDRMTRNPQWRKAYTEAFGPEYYREVRAWLKYVARPVSERGDKIDSFVNNQRSLATIFTLGLNTGTFIRQFQGYFQAIPDLGVKWALKGISRAVHSPFALIRNINEQSAYMADRDKNFVRDLRKNLIPPSDIIRVEVAGRTFTRDDVQEVAMSLVTLGDRLTTYPIWQGAYIKAVDSLNMGQAEAVIYANSLVQKTQASNSEAELNRWQRESGKSWKRLFTMFMSEALRKGSRMRYYWRAYQNENIGIGEYVAHLCMESVAPATYYVVLWSLLSSTEPDPEDIAEQIFMELTGPLPLINQLWSAVSYKKGRRSLTDSPAFRGVEATVELVKSTGKMLQHPGSASTHAAFFKSLVDVAAFSLGAGNVRRMYETAAQGWEDLERGRTANPFRLFFKPKK